MSTSPQRPLYRIVEWDHHYEVSQSKRAERPEKLAWVAIPNKHDGKGFRRVARQTDAADLFAAWVLILEVASKCAPRGTLIDSDGHLNAMDLADKTGFPERIFQRAFHFFTDSENGVRWLEIVAGTETKPAPSEPPRSRLGAAPETTPVNRTGQDRTGRDRTEQDTTLHNTTGQGAKISESPLPTPTAQKWSHRNYGEVQPEEIPVINDYPDIRSTPDPILAAMAITKERTKRAWGFWVKTLNTGIEDLGMEQALSLFFSCIETTYGEIKGGECKNPGASLNLNLKHTFTDNRGKRTTTYAVPNFGTGNPARTDGEKNT